MCGITAMFSPNQQPKHLIEALLNSLNHRGPDDKSYSHIRTRTGNNIYLLHNRLSIVDLSSAGSQPMVDEKTGIHLIFNGEIYNFREIRSVLKGIGYEFFSNTDSEVLLKGYIEWGKDIITKLNGMFAFVIWDPRNQKAFIARDRFGEKPLYYSKSKDGELIFSSEIKAIISLPNFKVDLDYEMLNNFLLGFSNFTLENSTPFKNINQVSPATCMEVSQSGEIIDTWRYWAAHRVDKQDRILVNERIIYEEFLHLFEKSIKNRADCDVQLSACLSGGLDSTSIVGVAFKENFSNFSSTISVCYEDDPAISEKNYLDEARKYFNGNHIYIEPTAKDLLNDVEKLFWHQELPIPSASMFLEWSVMKKAREQGNKVMLDGQGSDELLGGYPYYFRLYQNEMLHTHQYKELISNTFLFRKYLKEIALEYEDSHRRIPQGISYSFMELGTLFFRDFLKKIIGHNNTLNSEDLRRIEKSFSCMIEQGLSKTVLQEQLHSADRNGMAFGVETRFPFLDYDLVDFCLKTPLQFLISEGMQKYILRKAIKGIIPENIRLRKDKLGFAAPQDVWLKGDLKDWSHQMIMNPKLQNLASYEKKQAAELFFRFHQDSNYNLSNQIWRMASLGQWFSIFGG